MDIRKNAGYTIVDSVHIGDVEFVLGVNPDAPSPYVTWECKDSNYFFWGHYFSDLLKAKWDLLERSQTELKREEQFTQKEEI